MKLFEVKPTEEDMQLRQLLLTITKVFNGRFHKDGKDFVGEGDSGGIRVHPYIDASDEEPWAQIDCDNLNIKKSRLLKVIANDGWRYDQSSHHPDNPYIHVKLDGRTTRP